MALEVLSGNTTSCTFSANNIKGCLRNRIKPMENVQVQDNSTHTSSIFVLLEYLKWDTHHIPSVAF